MFARAFVPLNYFFLDDGVQRYFNAGIMISGEYAEGGRKGSDRVSDRSYRFDIGPSILINDWLIYGRFSRIGDPTGVETIIQGGLVIPFGTTRRPGYEELFDDYSNE